MNVLIITAHPESHSFNTHLASIAAGIFEKQGSIVESINLYSENFDPCEGKNFYPDRQGFEKFDTLREQRHHWNMQKLPEDVARHIELLKRSDLLLLHFPFWWFGMPAILKGWMDRIFVYGGIYDSQHRHENGVMKGKRALLTVSAGASANACGYNGRDGDMRLMLWPPIHALHYIGYTVLEPYLIHGVRGGLDGTAKEKQQESLNKKVQVFENRLTNLSEWPIIPFNKKEDFNDDMTLKPDAPEYSPFVRHARDNWKTGSF
ncbi:NAD(P)H dehydrogenase [Pectobacterium araliae]|uniref:NAD(P)H-dependent oxidoreductase n=1 Tax=Pectobacterium araliae TaxID=3073862 RepID=A0AAN0MJA5_9GAMM|nr:NAD(P)H-dependent oxidoreductase [Pectobacterium sp. MAFF 302110]GKW18449.1 NAD(P)H dehydrogenase [Pectobacterium carotovorum subsp. carotovorum]